MNKNIISIFLTILLSLILFFGCSTNISNNTTTTSSTIKITTTTSTTLISKINPPTWIQEIFRDSQKANIYTFTKDNIIGKYVSLTIDFKTIYYTCNITEQKTSTLYRLNISNNDINSEYLFEYKSNYEIYYTITSNGISPGKIILYKIPSISPPSWLIGLWTETDIKFNFLANDIIQDGSLSLVDTSRIISENIKTTTQYEFNLTTLPSGINKLYKFLYNDEKSIKFYYSGVYYGILNK